MEKIIFAFPGNELLAARLASDLHIAEGSLIIREFPDGESYVRVLSAVSGKEAIVACTLIDPDRKILPLLFLAKVLRDSGAKKITLVSPYLGYMRQDKAFNPGEAVTSEYFASLISAVVDELVTIDPHLHRRKTMYEIYAIPCRVIHSSSLISGYIKQHVKNPLLIGPDSESEQWVAEVATNADAPFLILQKERLGDNDVRIRMPDIENYRGRTPVLVDDIISTAQTMIKTIGQLRTAGLPPAICIAVHAVFAGTAFRDLKFSGAADVISCNTIIHESNKIDVSKMLTAALAAS